MKNQRYSRVSTVHSHFIKNWDVYIYMQTCTDTGISGLVQQKLVTKTPQGGELED